MGGEVVGLFLSSSSSSSSSTLKVGGSQRRQMRLFPSSISSWTLSLEVAISAWAEKTAQMKVSTVPPMAV